MGTSYAIKLLKSDIEKYFYSLDHEVIINLLKPILSNEELKLIKVILNSTNKDYINKTINNYEKKNCIVLPKYTFGKGIPIGNMTSQYLAILYLSKLQHHITNDLKIKFVNYMDDYILIHESNAYLKKALKIIEIKLDKEYKLKLNYNKTKISSCQEGITFLGYNFKVIVE